MCSSNLLTQALKRWAKCSLKCTFCSKCSAFVWHTDVVQHGHILLNIVKRLQMKIEAKWNTQYWSTLYITILVYSRMLLKGQLRSKVKVTFKSSCQVAYKYAIVTTGLSSAISEISGWTAFVCILRWLDDDWKFHCMKAWSARTFTGNADRHAMQTKRVNANISKIAIYMAIASITPK